MTNVGSCHGLNQLTWTAVWTTHTLYSLLTQWGKEGVN